MSAKHFWRMTSGKIMEGVFAINKPSGISSAQALRDLQTHFNPSSLFAPSLANEKSQRERESHNQRYRRRQKKIQVKIGHGGTLDPLATGVLITGVGKGTKSLQDFLLCTKVYECVILFGTTTDTYDRVGKVLRRAPYEHVTKELVEEKLGQFRGKFMQLPPLFSALKMDGKPLYEYAREGKPIPREIERRPVEVLELEMLEWMEGGTHNHKAPEEEAGYAEINIANKLWKQEGVTPAGGSPIGKGSERDEKDRRELFERRKRKLSADQDELVKEMPPWKARRGSGQDATMSGGLAPPGTEADEDIPVVKATIEKSPTPPLSASVTNSESKGPPAAKLRMVVTSGFYVRSLCHDLGAAVGSAALMAELQRTRQGDFELGKNVLEYEELDKGEKVWGPKVEGMLDEWYEKEKSTRLALNSRSSGGGSTKPGRDSRVEEKGDQDGKTTDEAVKEEDNPVEEKMTIGQPEKEKSEGKAVKKEKSPVVDAVATAVEDVAKATTSGL